MNETEKEKVLRLIDEFSRDKDILEVVKRIESSVPATKGHYGRYLTFLTPYQDNKGVLAIITGALMKAGANRFGVESAYSLITG